MRESATDTHQRNRNSPHLFQKKERPVDDVDRCYTPPNMSYDYTILVILEHTRYSGGVSQVNQHSCTHALLLGKRSHIVSIGTGGSREELHSRDFGFIRASPRALPFGIIRCYVGFPFESELILSRFRPPISRSLLSQIRTGASEVLRRRRAGTKRDPSRPGSDHIRIFRNPRVSLVNLTDHLVSKRKRGV